MLLTVGYTPDNIVADARTTPIAGSGGVRRLDLVAYGRRYGPFDASTATIVIEVADDEHSDTAREQILANAALSLSAPAVIIARSGGWSLYAVNPTGGLSLLRNLNWREDLGSLRALLNPVALLDAKLGSRQLSLRLGAQ